MTSPTQISVSTDSGEYSRYETEKDTIRATVVVQGGAIYSNEQVLVELIKARRSRDIAVASITLTYTGSSDPQEAMAEFYLPAIVDQDLISLVRFGKYFIRATSVSNTTVSAESPEFSISVITVAKLKSDYLFGLTLAATEIKAPKFQPQQITGVTLEELSPTHPLGFGTLQYIYNTEPTANATTSIGSGANGTIVAEAVGSLAGATGNGVTLSVVVPSGTSALSTSYAAGALTVNLAVIAGVPDGSANTATLIAAAIDALPLFTATASGSGSGVLSSASGPVLFTGGLTSTLRQISWNGGSVVSITKPGLLILQRGSVGPTAGIPNLNNNDYICVKIASLLSLPVISDTESILIDKQKLDDTALASYVLKATSWVENDVLAGYIEPTNVVTERDPTTIQYTSGNPSPSYIFMDTDYDFIVSPLTHFMPKGTTQWVGIQTQFPQVLRVDSLYGAIANTRVIDMDLDWIQVATHGGFIQLVPFNQDTAFNFLGFIGINAIRGAMDLPNFWRFNMIVGLREASADIRDLIAKKAAIDALVVAGMAMRPGVGSVSLSRDGVSESVSYVTTAQYGMYTGTINAYKEFIKDNLQAYKGKYRGPGLIVV